jgi:hypothetical protein
MFHGGTLVPRGGRRSAYSLRLPEPLQLGQSHDLALRARLGREQHGRPWFAVVLEHPCATLDLRVRFDRRRVPARITAFEHVHPRDFTTAPGGMTVHADAAGEVQASFTDLTPGMAYGVRWDTARRAEDGTGVLAARTRSRGDQIG